MAVREGWGNVVEDRPAEPDDGGPEADVLGAYLEGVRARLSGERFEVVIRAVQATCALLGESPHRTVVEVPGGGELAPELQREYLSLLAVMITGRRDHHLVALAAPEGDKGWAVVETTGPRSEDAERMWIQAQLDGIVSAGKPSSP
ncbi:hypothetical protein HYE82_02780 [Streptomyces sp. BR123]|uniref:hypothetical protein n=1 Tax=Streptomyces sp. BR123 TaxID=2749828 RepID=UPI0015C4C87E|nr:hypothetical protein [Streptomyces sp. BR123]NXY93353.1 hypothetical protein [Streptomyces sp. BR123]